MNYKCKKCKDNCITTIDDTTITLCTKCYDMSVVITLSQNYPLFINSNSTQNPTQDVSYIQIRES